MTGEEKLWRSGVDRWHWWHSWHGAQNEWDWHRNMGIGIGRDTLSQSVPSGKYRLDDSDDDGKQNKELSGKRAKPCILVE